MKIYRKILLTVMLLAGLAVSTAPTLTDKPVNAPSPVPEMNMEIRYNDVPYCAGTEIEITLITRLLTQTGGLEECALGNGLAHLLTDVRYNFEVTITDDGDPSNNTTLNFSHDLDLDFVTNHNSPATPEDLGNGFSIYFNDSDWVCGSCSSGDDTIYSNPNYYPYIGECDSEFPRRPDAPANGLAVQPNFVSTMTYTVPSNIVGPGTISFANTTEEGYVVLSSLAFGNYYLPPQYQSVTAEGNIESGGGSTPVIAIDAPANCSPLPIFLYDFSVEDRSGNAHLSWEIASDENSTIELQRSLTGTDFTTIKTIYLSPEDRSDRYNFEYLDENAQPGINYYRLKMNWQNGWVEYSDLLSYFSDKPNDPVVQVFPNPVAYYLHIENADNVQSCSLYSSQGIKVMARSWNQGSAGVMDLGELESGIYYLKLKTPQGTQTHKLVKL